MAFSLTKKRSGPVARTLRHGDVPWSVILIIMSAIVLVLVILIGLSIWQGSALSRATFGLNFVTPHADTSWDPVNDQFDAWPIIIGTLVTALVAIVLATPISMFIAIFLAELCPDRLRTPVNFMVE